MSNSSALRRRTYAFCIMLGIAAVAVALLVASPGNRGAADEASSRSMTSKSGNIASAARGRVQANFAALPLAFEQNVGQSDPVVRYVARGNGYKLFLTSSEAIFRLHKRGEDSEVRDMIMNRRIGPSGVRSMLRRRAQQKSKELLATVRMSMLGANPAAQVNAGAPQSGKVNYFIGNDPSRWRSDVPLFGQVSYRNLYPGIDLAFRGNGKQLEFDYLVNPGANTGSIALGFQGAEQVATNAAGDLILTTAAGPVEMHRPIAYQEKDGMRQTVDVRFVASANRVTFAVGLYDRSRQLVIDPTVTYSTYFGGDTADYGLAIAVDASGNELIAGATDSDTIPGWKTATNGASFDVFVTKVNSAGVLQFTTEFGGSDDDFPGGIAVDSTGIYVSGTTDSSDFPVTPGAAQTTFVGGGPNGNNDAFAAKLTLTGSITWATFINGSDSTSGLAVAVDTSQNVYVVGETFAPDLGGVTGGVNPLPHGNALNLGSGSGDDDGYIVKVNSTGSAFDLVSYIGGSSGDLATGVALDGSGNIYVSGETVSIDLPVTAGVVQSKCGSDGTCNNTTANGPLDDAFVFAIAADLAGYNYGTYYGGSNVDDALAIAADSAGDAFITGLSQSSDFPTAGTPYQSTLAGAENAFAVELNPTGSAAIYGTYLGGSGTDLGVAIALDRSTPANIYVTGQTSSSDFPTVNPTQAALSGTTDAFVSVLSPIQKTALFSTYLGGGGDEDQLAGAIGLDSTEKIYVTGDTDSGNGSTAAFPTKAALDTTYGGGTCVSKATNVPCTDAFIVAYGPATVPDFVITASALSPASVNPGSNATSTVTVTALNAYSNTINLTCSVSGGGSPAPTCALSSASTTGSGTSSLTVTTTGTSGALFMPHKVFYGLWLPVAGMSLIGMRFGSARSRRKQFLGFLILGIVMAALFLLPACGGGSSGSGGGGGGCTGCTAAGSYTVTVTGTGTDTANTTRSTTTTLTVN